MPFVPTNQLLFWTGCLFAPACTIAAMIPQAGPVCYAVIGAFVLITIADILISRNIFNGIRVELPGVVRMSKGRDAEIALVIIKDNSKIKQLRLGLLLPDFLISGSPDLHVELPEKKGRLTLPWPCKALKRGRFLLERCCFEAASPLGFWARRHTVPVNCEIRAYPDILVERKSLAAFFMKNNFGVHAHHQIGKGRDFERLREYMPGDSFEDIHWKATAKRSQPICKVYQIEKTQSIYVVVDASRLSARNAMGFNQDPDRGRGSGQKRSQDTILEKYITAALAVGMAAERQGDNFGIAAFSDHITSFLGARSGRAHYQSCRDILYLLEHRQVTPDFTEMCTTLAAKARKRSLLIILTSLDDPTLSETFIRNIEMLAKRHLVMVNMLRPAMANPLFQSRVKGQTSEMYAHLAGHVLWETLDQTAKTLARTGVDFTLLDNDKMCLQLITQYLNIKKRQVL